MDIVWVLLGLCMLGALCAAWVIWHAAKRLRLTKQAVEDTDFPNGSGG